MKVIPQMRRVD